MHRKMDCNSRKFKGLPQQQQHIHADLHEDIDQLRLNRRTTDGFVMEDISKDRMDQFQKGYS
jgi:hypothetical protein